MARIITPEEAAALLKFRARIPDILSTFNEYYSHDIWLLKWLRDKSLSIDRAEDQLRKWLKWREAENIDEIPFWRAPEYVRKIMPVQVPGVDKNGVITCFVQFGHWKLKKGIRKGYKGDMMRYVEQLIELGLRQAELYTTKEKYLSKVVIILDFDGFSVSQLFSKDAIDFLYEIAKTQKAYYPECLEMMWVVNGMWYMDLLYRMLTPLLTARTVSKIQLFGREGYRECLREHFDPDQLPCSLGGANTTVSFFDITKYYSAVERYKLDPEFQIDKYFVKNVEKPAREYLAELFKPNPTFPKSQFSLCVLQPGQVHSVEYDLTPGNQMSWNFQTDDLFIGFVVQFVAGEDEGKNREMEILSAEPRTDAHINLQKGRIVAEKKGSYALHLENPKCNEKPLNVYYVVQVKRNNNEKSKSLDA